MYRYLRFQQNDRLPIQTSVSPLCRLLRQGLKDHPHSGRDRSVPIRMISGDREGPYSKETTTALLARSFCAVQMRPEVASSKHLDRKTCYKLHRNNLAGHEKRAKLKCPSPVICSKRSGWAANRCVPKLPNGIAWISRSCDACRSGASRVCWMRATATAKEKKTATKADEAA